MNDDLIGFLYAAFIGIIAWFFGGLDGFIKVLLAFSVVDYFSGVAVAFVQHNISSKIGFNGILKKSVMFSLVGIANLVDHTFLGNGDAVRTVVVLFYIGNEGVSIMENAYKLGVPFPDALKKRFLQFIHDDNNPNHNLEQDNNTNQK